MTTRYPRVYLLIKRAGHTPYKALEIIIDAKRGNVHALTWIKTLRRQHADANRQAQEG